MPSVNVSSDDLWTDTDDESFVRATQCMMEVAGNSFTSPVAVSRCTAVTSTPNIKLAQCRRTFSLDQRTPTVPRRMNLRPRHAGPAASASSSLPVVTSSLLSDASFSDELLATLAEPDEVLDSQLKLTNATEAVERHSPVFSSVTEKCNANTLRGNLSFHKYWFSVSYIDALLTEMFMSVYIRTL